MDRILYLDGFPEGERFQNVRTLVSKEDIEDLYQNWFYRADHPELTIDCCNLEWLGYNRLLKFIEEFKGKLILLAVEPIPPTILSRFSRHCKVFKSREGHLLEIRVNKKIIPKSIWDKIEQMFGLSREEEEDTEDESVSD